MPITVIFLGQTSSSTFWPETQAIDELDGARSRVPRPHSQLDFTNSPMMHPPLGSRALGRVSQLRLSPSGGPDRAIRHSSWKWLRAFSKLREINLVSLFIERIRVDYVGLTVEFNGFVRMLCLLVRTKRVNASIKDGRE